MLFSMPASATSWMQRRSDAKRNHERIVAAARPLLAHIGVGVSVDEISRAAGVGMGTLYRHFPTKEDLVDAVLEDAFGEFLQLARVAVEEPDAWQGLSRFLERALALHAANCGLMDVLASQAHGRERAAAMRRRLRPLLAELVARAQAQGALRADFSADDLPLLLWGGDGVIEYGSSASPQIWRRYLGIVLDGLRAEAASPLPHPPLTRAELSRAGRSPR
jgi:AcrR family transcriptional regulator